MKSWQLDVKDVYAEMMMPHLLKIVEKLKKNFSQEN